MARRGLLSEAERRALFGVPEDRDALVRLYMLSRADLARVRARRGAANRLGYAVQLALLRHPGLVVEPTPELVAFLAEQISVPDEALEGYTESERFRGTPDFRVSVFQKGCAEESGTIA